MTNDPREIHLDSIPSMGSMLLKAATSRKAKQSKPQFLPLTIRANGVTVDRVKLEKFRAVCDFDSNDTLPLTYPHIMAFPLHMQLMLAPEFPFSPVGSVHIRNRIRQQRAIGVNETLDFCVRMGSGERVDKGYEASVITEVRVAGELVWDDLSVLLIRRSSTDSTASKDGAEKKQKRRRADPISYTKSVNWQLASNKSRQYAAASGDYNPIHLYPLTAKLMGFKRHIMHGMWSKSRAVAHLLDSDHLGPVSVDVAFKLPIFLPASVSLMVNSDGNSRQFEMKDGKGEKPHLAGELRLGEGITD